MVVIRYAHKLLAGRKEDERKDGKVKGDGDTKDEPPIKPDKIKAGTDRVADLLDSGEDLVKAWN